MKGAEKTSDLMNYVTPKIISNMRPSANVQEETVSENVTSGIKVAKNVTGAAVEVTGFVGNLKVNNLASSFSLYNEFCLQLIKSV